MTGIQYDVRMALKEWLASEIPGFRVELVYTPDGQQYFYARRLTMQFLGIDSHSFADQPIDYADGDVFFGLGLQPHLQSPSHDVYRHMCIQGVTMKFAAYDLLSNETLKMFCQDGDNTLCN